MLLVVTWLECVEQRSGVEQRSALTAEHVWARSPAGGFPRTGPEQPNLPPQPGPQPLAGFNSGSLKTDVKIKSSLRENELLFPPSCSPSCPLSCPPSVSPGASWLLASCNLEDMVQGVPQLVAANDALLFPAPPPHHLQPVAWTCWTNPNPNPSLPSPHPLHLYSPALSWPAIPYCRPAPP